MMQRRINLGGSTMKYNNDRRRVFVLSSAFVILCCMLNLSSEKTSTSSVRLVVDAFSSYEVFGVVSNPHHNPRHQLQEGPIIESISSVGRSIESSRSPFRSRDEGRFLKTLAYRSCVRLKGSSEGFNGFANNDSEYGGKGGKRRKKNSRRYYNRLVGKNNTTTDINVVHSSQHKKDEENEKIMNRITQLEGLVASQTVEIRKLRQECKRLSEAASTFADVVDLLRQAGMNLQSDTTNPDDSSSNIVSPPSRTNSIKKVEGSPVEYLEDSSDIFGSAPPTVIDAADAAGASVLAAILAGKHRLLVDVRDAELTRDPEILIQFMELTILPVAAGLEGLKSTRNRVKIVFPTISQLMTYRRSMCLSAPEVVSLSTLDFDPVEDNDNLVVLLAPSPDDEEGLARMNELIHPSDPFAPPLQQPVVIINPHMVPLSGPATQFEKIYHLRLLTVQYMTGDVPPEGWADAKTGILTNSSSSSLDLFSEQEQEEEEEDAALEAALEHAHERGVHQGITRAMVIRAYPKPWHVFVDTSPDTNADFEVAATFDEEPSPEDVNYAIVECLEGSEREDELVAQQMQQALESGQLNKVAEMLGFRHNIEIDENDIAQTLRDFDDTDDNHDDDNNVDDDDAFDWDPFDTDTV